MKNAGKNVGIKDFHDILNSLAPPPPPIAPIDSVVSFDVEWQAKSGLTQIRDATNQFVGRFADSSATISWSASQRSTGFEFTSDAASTSTTVSGVIGHERNGKFFS
jgi:hypothetical protein